MLLQTVHIDSYSYHRLWFRKSWTTFEDVNAAGSSLIHLCDAVHLSLEAFTDCSWESFLFQVSGSLLVFFFFVCFSCGIKIESVILKLVKGIWEHVFDDNRLCLWNETKTHPPALNLLLICLRKQLLSLNVMKGYPALIFLFGLFGFDNPSWILNIMKKVCSRVWFESCYFLFQAAFWICGACVFSFGMLVFSFFWWIFFSKVIHPVQ